MEPITFERDGKSYYLLTVKCQSATLHALSQILDLATPDDLRAAGWVPATQWIDLGIRLRAERDQARAEGERLREALKQAVERDPTLVHNGCRHGCVHISAEVLDCLRAALSSTTGETDPEAERNEA